MRKRLLTGSIVVLLIISTVYFVWQTYDLSTDYNYATAKLDIKNGNVKVINIGAHKISSKEKDLEMLSARYGFKNIYIEKFTAQQTEKGIQDYNELIETYLVLRNGADWKKNYEREADSLQRAAEAGKDQNY